MIDDTSFISNKFFGGFHNSLHKYTIELLYDGYPLPDKYINLKNKILYQYPKIYKNLVRQNDLMTIEKIIKIPVNSARNAEHVAKYAAKFGDINILKWTSKICEFNEKIIKFAVSGNQLEILKWLEAHYYNYKHDIVHHAIKKGRIEIAKYFMDHKNFSLYFKNQLRIHCSYDMIEFLYSFDPSLLENICQDIMWNSDFNFFQVALLNGWINRLTINKANDYVIYPCPDVKILSWLIDNNYAQDNYKISHSLAHCGNLEGLRFFHSNGLLVLTSDMFNSAMHICDVDMMQFLYDLECPRYDLTIEIFVYAHHGKFEYCKRLSEDEFWVGIKLLEKWGFEWGDVCTPAAIYGDLELLKYAHKRGCQLTNRIIKDAAFYGYLHIIIWARENGCDWDAMACEYSIMGYNFDILKWLINHNNFRSTCPLISNEIEICPWDIDGCRHVPNYNVLKFAVENNCAENITFSMENINDYF